jgi:endonuclease-3 related protein
MTVIDIFNRLLSHYGFQNWWPIVENGVSVYSPEFRMRSRTCDEIFEIAVGAILTQNTAWKNVEKAIINLKQAGVLSYKSILNLPVENLASLIKPSGYFNQKAKKLKGFAEFIDKRLDCNIENLRKFDTLTARNLLLEIWGVGYETADSILLYGLNFPIFVVDAYTHRIFSRMGIIRQDFKYETIRLFFENNLPKDHLIYNEYHALIVKHGVNKCRKKAICDNCVIRDICPY